MKYEKITRTVKVTDATVLIVDEPTNSVRAAAFRIYGWIESKIKVKNSINRIQPGLTVLSVIRIEHGVRTYEMSAQDFITGGKEVQRPP